MNHKILNWNEKFCGKILKQHYWNAGYSFDSKMPRKTVVIGFSEKI